MQRMREGMERVQRTEDAVRSLPATPLMDPEERESCEERVREDEIWSFEERMRAGEGSEGSEEGSDREW